VILLYKRGDVMNKGYVYVVGDKSKSKIGFSCSPERRTKDVSRLLFNSNAEIFISDYSECAFSWESAIHRDLSGNCIEGEMFSVSFDVAVKSALSIEPTNEDQVKSNLINSMTREVEQTADKMLSMILNGERDIINGVSVINLTRIWTYGNQLRVSEGKSIANLSSFLKSSKAIEFANDNNSTVTATGKGNAKKTMSDVGFAVFAGKYLSTKFHLAVIQSFVKNKMLEYENESGDNFKAMNVAIDNFLPEREGKDNKGLRIQIAKQIKHKVNPELINWNDATADELRYRSEIEDKISSLLSIGVVNNYEHLKELITKL